MPAPKAESATCLEFVSLEPARLIVAAALVVVALGRFAFGPIDCQTHHGDAGGYNQRRCDGTCSDHWDEPDFAIRPRQAVLNARGEQGALRRAYGGGTERCLD